MQCVIVGLSYLELFFLYIFAFLFIHFIQVKLFPTGCWRGEPPPKCCGHYSGLMEPVLVLTLIAEVFHKI